MSTHSPSLEQRLFTDRYGVVRIKEQILTIEHNTPVVLTFDEACSRLIPDQDLSPEMSATRLANRAVLERSMPKLYPYQGGDTLGNRKLHAAKLHAVLHRALWVRELSTLAQDWSDPRYRKYVTAKDLKQYPKLKELLADPDRQYRDPRSERNGHVSLRSVAMDSALSWSPEIVSGVTAEKKINRQSIAGRLEMVPWVEVPEQVELVLLTDEEAAARFGPIADGVIPVSKGACHTLRVMSRNGHPMSLKTGDKLRGAVIPFKGTVRRVPGKRPEIYLVEGGALKVALSEDTPRRIVIPREELLKGAFAVETPSLERVIENPRFAGHMLNLLVGQVRAHDPEAADRLVPRISDRIIRMASGKGEVLDYVDLCLYPVKGLPLDRNLAREVCRQVLTGELNVPIERGIITVPGASEGDPPYSFGITSAGRLLLRGVPPAYETVWTQLELRIVSEIYRELYPRVAGCGGLAQGDPSVPIGTVKVSRILAEHPDGVKEAALMYWPSKQPHCLHRVTVVVDERLDGSVIRLHPDVLETLGGDSDGDLIYLITEPPIVKASRTITEPVTLVESASYYRFHRCLKTLDPGFRRGDSFSGRARIPC